MRIYQIASVIVAMTFFLAPKPDHPDAGNISGKVSIEGQPSNVETIDMSADPNCAKVSPAPPLEEKVVVGNGNVLENVVVYISSGAPPEDASPSQVVPVTQKGCRYLPHIVVAEVNQKFDFINEDSTPHTIHSMGKANPEWNGFQPAGGPPVERKFANEDFIPVVCGIHPWMRGYLVVLRTSHFAVTGADGSFKLGNLPPGKYTITAWHETYGVQTREVNLQGNDASPIDFVFKAK